MDRQEVAVELSEGPMAFSDLIGRRVEDPSGRSIGRIFEARGHWERDGSIVLDELMVGRSAFWQRLREPGGEARGIPWENVVELGERIIVRT
jgi:sporulation protein YlmC with PRC-barrel domain